MPETKLRVHIRWMIKIDMREVLRIEAASFDRPWPEEEFLRILRERDCIGMTAEIGEGVVGFMVYRLHRTWIEVLDFAVDPALRRAGIGSQMVDKLVGKLSADRRTRLAITVADTNLGAHLFLRDRGFLAEEVIRDREGDGLDGYRFAFTLGEAARG